MRAAARRRGSGNIRIRRRAESEGARRKRPSAGTGQSPAPEGRMVTSGACARTVGMEPLGIALLGCGTVGGGVAKLLLEQPQRLAARAGRPLALRRVVVRDPTKPRAVPLPTALVSTELRAALHDPSVQVVVEVVGGVDWARRAILDALAAGKDVVTANKA